MSVLVPSQPTSLTRSTVMTNGQNYSLDRQHSPSVASLPKCFNVPFAIQHGYFRCIRYLLQLRYDPNERDGQLRTPLILCAYVDNDRWSLSLAQNLLEKGAKVALEDHARRNAMHHACALQRLHLVKLFLSCLDFNIDAKDCEGNTCLHYVAITGNCEIAELLMRTAEKVGVRLDQVVNREGCSAAVLALKYGHLECANQITHRDSDEFFVVPCPLSIYETIPANEEVQTPSNHSSVTKKKIHENTSHKITKRLNNHSTSFSFGPLKIIFNESDPGYSTRLAGLCREDKETRRKKRKIHEKKSEALEQSLMTMTKPDRTTSTMIDEMQCSSTEAVVNAVQTLHLNREKRLNGYRPHMDLSPLAEASPRIPFDIDSHDILQKSSSTFVQMMNSKVNVSLDEWNKTHSIINPKLTQHDELKSKHSNSTAGRQSPQSTLTQIESDVSRSTTKKVTRSPMVNRQTSAFRPVSNGKSVPSPIKKTSANDRYRSPSNSTRPLESDSSTLIPSVLAGRSLSNLGRYRSAIGRPTDGSLSIQEAKGPTSRYNKPEELFGLRPAELFGSDDHQPKILDPRSNQNRSKRPSTHLWQQDLDQVINLYSIHQSPNYRRSALPPHSTATPIIGPHETSSDLGHIGRHRRGSISRTPSINQSKMNLQSKPSVIPPTHLPRRNSISRPASKTAHAS